VESGALASVSIVVVEEVVTISALTTGQSNANRLREDIVGNTESLARDVKIAVGVAHSRAAKETQEALVLALVAQWFGVTLVQCAVQVHSTVGLSETLDNVDGVFFQARALCLTGDLLGTSAGNMEELVVAVFDGNVPIGTGGIGKVSGSTETASFAGSVTLTRQGTGGSLVAGRNDVFHVLGGNLAVGNVKGGLGGGGSKGEEDSKAHHDEEELCKVLCQTRIVKATGATNLVRGLHKSAPKFVATKMGVRRARRYKFSTIVSHRATVRSAIPHEPILGGACRKRTKSAFPFSSIRRASIQPRFLSPMQQRM